MTKASIYPMSTCHSKKEKDVAINFVVYKMLDYN